MAQVRQSDIPRVVLFLLAVLAGITAFAVGLQLAGMSLKLMLFGAMGAGIFGLAFVSGYPKAVLLFAWVFSLTYNRQYFNFDAIVGKYGAGGPYWIVSDVFLISLLVLWVAELVLLKRTSPPRGDRLWPWYLPFVIACFISILFAEETAWGFFEMIRVVKVALILLYFRYNVGKVEWWACVAALGCAVIAQSALGTIEVAVGRTGVFGVLGLSGAEAAGPEELSQENFYGWRRATATMTHPPNLACYLVLTIPLFLTLGLTFRHRLIQILAFATGVIGLVGLACTLSRWPWMLAGVQGILILGGLCWLGLMPLERTLGLFCVAVFLGMLVLAPFTGLIMDRLTRDLKEFIDFRAKENQLGMDIGMGSPFVGVGLNNYKIHMARRAPEWEWALNMEEYSIKQLHIRPIAAPHNGFLAIFAETGILGLGSYGIYLLGVLRITLKAIRSTEGYLKSACFGVLLGFLGLIAQQAIDFSLWVDPLLYTFPIMIGMANAAPSLFGGPDGDEALEVQT